MCCQVQDAEKLSVTHAEPINGTTPRSTPLAQPASSAEPVKAASSNDQRNASSVMPNQAGTSARLTTPAKPQSNGNEHASSDGPAEALIKPEATQQEAAPATGSAALLARIRSAPHYSSC